MQFAGVSNIYTNGCAPNSLLDPPVGPTVDDLVTASANIPQLAAAVAIVLFTTIGTNPIGAGLSVAFLLCRIVMRTVMWLLMRQEKPTTIDRQRDDAPEQTTTTTRH